MKEEYVVLQQLTFHCSRCDKPGTYHQIVMRDNHGYHVWTRPPAGWASDGRDDMCAECYRLLPTGGTLEGP